MIESEMIDLTNKTMFDKTWNIFCKEIYEYHQEQLNLIADKEENVKYIESMSELEFKIWAGVKLGGIINPMLALHRDFKETYNKFWKKPKNANQS